MTNKTIRTMLNELVVETARATEPGYKSKFTIDRALAQIEQIISERVIGPNYTAICEDPDSIYFGETVTSSDADKDEQRNNLKKVL